MRSLFVILTALLLVSGVSFAQDEMPDQQMEEPMAEEQTITATVEEVDEDNMVITVIGPEGNMMEFTLSKDTEIMDPDGETMKVGDLPAGRTVIIYYTGTLEDPTVTRVMVVQEMEQ